MNERSRLLSSRRWDNTVGSLNRENLPYFTGKLEKYASQTTEEKIIGLQESSSFLGALILDENGIVKNNVYADILKILQPVFQSDFNGIVKNDFSYKLIRDLILKSPEASLKYIWSYLKNELSSNHHLAKTP